MKFQNINKYAVYYGLSLVPTLVKLKTLFFNQEKLQSVLYR